MIVHWIYWVLLLRCSRLWLYMAICGYVPVIVGVTKPCISSSLKGDLDRFPDLIPPFALPVADGYIDPQASVIFLPIQNASGCNDQSQCRSFMAGRSCYVLSSVDVFESHWGHWGHWGNCKGTRWDKHNKKHAQNMYARLSCTALACWSVSAFTSSWQIDQTKDLRIH